MGKYLSSSFSERSNAYTCLLAVDTATQACSIAVSVDNDLVVETTSVTRQTHSRHLLSMIEGAMGVAGIQLSELDGLVVTKGPGSFTGLRIGVSTIKGLARALKKEIIGVSYLECLARQSGVTNGLVCAAIDARREEFYYALYRFGDTGIETVVPETVGPVSGLFQKIDGKCYFIGNGIYPNRQRLRERFGALVAFAPDCNTILRAGTVLDQGRALLKSGRQDNLDHLIPSYIRKSDAQINLEKRCAEKGVLL